MIILGLDISSNSTGWALLKNQLLDTYGLIKPDSSMSVSQKLYFFGNEIKKLIEQCQPDEIVIEEVVLVRGPTVMRTLASFRGVALFQAYSYQKREVTTYEPTTWKKAIELSGSAKKADIQLKICEIFKILDKEKIETYRKSYACLIENVYLQKKKKSSDLKEVIIAFEDDVKKKKNRNEHEIYNSKVGEIIFPEVEFTKTNEPKVRSVKKAIKDIEKQYKKLKLKDLKETEKKIDRMSVDIYSDCGINSDIADAIGVALAKIKGR